MFFTPATPNPVVTPNNIFSLQWDINTQAQVPLQAEAEPGQQPTYIQFNK